MRTGRGKGPKVSPHPLIFSAKQGFRERERPGRSADLREDKEEKRDELERVREMADRLEGDVPEQEAIDLLEKAVEEVERFGKDLEEGGG